MTEVIRSVCAAEGEDGVVGSRVWVKARAHDTPLVFAFPQRLALPAVFLCPRRASHSCA